MASQLQKMASLGMTTMHTYAADIWKYFEDVDVYAQLDQQGLLPLRVTVYQDRLENLKGSWLAVGKGKRFLRLRFVWADINCFAMEASVPAAQRCMSRMPMLPKRWGSSLKISNRWKVKCSALRVRASSARCMQSGTGRLTWW